MTAVVAPPGLPSGIPGAGIPATVANLPPGLAQLPAGSVIAGTVTGRDGAGNVLLRTAAGTMAVATSLKLVRGNVVSMRVRGGPVFALAIEAVDGKPPPPATETAPAPAAARAASSGPRSSSSYTADGVAREVMVTPAAPVEISQAAQVEISQAARATPAAHGPALPAAPLTVEAATVEAATVQAATEPPREAPLDLARLTAGTRLTATVVERDEAGHLLLRADAGTLSVTTDLDLAPGNVVDLRVGNGPTLMLVVESVDGAPPPVPLGRVAAMRPLATRSPPAPVPTPTSTPMSPVAGGAAHETQAVVVVPAGTGAPSRPVPSPDRPPAAAELSAPRAAAAPSNEPSGAPAAVASPASSPPPAAPTALSPRPRRSGQSPMPLTVKSSAGVGPASPRTLGSGDGVSPDGVSSGGNSRDGAALSPRSPASPAVPGALAAAPWEAPLARGVLAGRLHGFSRAWPELGEAVMVLRRIDPGLANGLVQRVIPAPGANLGSSMLFFLSALTRGDLAGWLGRGAVARLEEAGHGDVMGRLANSFGQLARLAEPPALGEWQALFVPLFDGETERQVRLFIRRHSRHGGDDDDGDETRFIVELDLDRLGEIQLDGLVREQAFDLIIRSSAALPPSAKRDITEIFTEGLAITGFTGSLTFQVARDFPVLPIDDILAAEHHGLLV